MIVDAERHGGRALILNPAKQLAKIGAETTMLLFSPSLMRNSSIHPSELYTWTLFHRASDEIQSEPGQLHRDEAS